MRSAHRTAGPQETHAFVDSTVARAGAGNAHQLRFPVRGHADQTDQPRCLLPASLGWRLSLLRGGRSTPSGHERPSGHTSENRLAIRFARRMVIVLPVPRRVNRSPDPAMRVDTVDSV